MDRKTQPIYKYTLLASPFITWLSWARGAAAAEGRAAGDDRTVRGEDTHGGMRAGGRTAGHAVNGEIRSGLVHLEPCG